MYEIFTNGEWEVEPGNEEAFIEAWSEFAAWASERPGAGTLRLVRDVRAPGRFVSFGQWDDANAVRAWKSSAEFKERIGRVVSHTTDFEPTELVGLRKVRGGAVETLSPPAEIEPIHAAKNGTANPEEEEAMSVHYKKDGIATFDASTEKIFQYMSAGEHPHASFKSHRLVGVSDNVVTAKVEVYHPDGSTSETIVEQRLDPPKRIETTMSGGAFDGARFTHTYRALDGQTKVDLEGDFPAMPGMSEADELKMIDDFFSRIFAEDTATLRTWSPAE